MMEKVDFDRWQARLAAARGDLPADLKLINGRVINVFNCTIEETSVAIFDGHVVGFGDYPAAQTYDLQGRYLAPGFIEGHIHVESSKLTPIHFADVVAIRGATTVIADPHEIANVLGAAGIRYMLEQSLELPITIKYMLPSCVPATNMETAGATLSAADMEPFLDDPNVLGIAEMMNFPGAYHGDRSVLQKLALASGGKPIDGHAPGLGGRNLAAYLVAGPATDHECFTLDEAAEKLARGMRIMIREGSTAKNLKTLLPLVNPATERRCMFVSDDRRAGDLLNEGHLDHILRKAVALGLDPVTAIRMVTLNTAEAFGLRGRGGIRPGWRADLVAIEDLTSFKVSAVWKLGKLIVQEGELVAHTLGANARVERCRLPIPVLSAEDLKIEDKGLTIKVIGLVPDQIFTEALTAVLPAAGGVLASDTESDILKLIVIERYTGKGGMGRGFVRGFGLKRGAIGSTVAHDSHNVIVVGVDDESILRAVEQLTKIGGGQVVAEGAHIRAELPLPVAGLMSDKPALDVARAEDKLIEAASNLGCVLSDPFMALSFLALPVIPRLKLTDKGLVDVDRFEVVSLYG